MLIPHITLTQIAVFNLLCFAAVIDCPLPLPLIVPHWCCFCLLGLNENTSVVPQAQTGRCIKRLTDHASSQPWACLRPCVCVKGSVRAGVKGEFG